MTFFSFSAVLGRGRDGYLPGALAALERARELEPAFSADVLLELGVLADENGDPARAEILFQDSLLADATRARAHHNLAHLCLRQRRFVEAITHYENALVRDPRYLLSLHQLSYLLVSAEPELLRDPARALELVERALVLEPQDEVLLATRELARQQL